MFFAESESSLRPDRPSPASSEHYAEESYREKGTFPVRTGTPKRRDHSPWRCPSSFLDRRYANSNGAVGYYYIDTTTLTNGIHTIGWLVYDNAGRGAGIGSRFFWVQN